MATGMLPDAGQILNSLINSILLVDDDVAVHYANPAAQQLLAQSSLKRVGVAILPSRNQKPIFIRSKMAL